MGTLGLSGCEVQQFDLYAREEGSMALLRREDLRLLIKREPEFSAYLYTSLAVKTLNTISHQYFDADYVFTKLQKPSETSIKKIMLYMD